MIKLYSKPACVQCVATRQYLDKKEIPYEYIDIQDDIKARELLTDLGIKQLPYLVRGDESWTGFRPDKLIEDNNDE